MKNDKLGLGLIAITLVVLALVATLAQHMRQRAHEEKAHTIGMLLSRSLSSVDVERWTDPIAGKALLSRMAGAVGGGDLAWAAISGRDGGIRLSTGALSPDIQAPPNEPHAWNSEQRRRPAAADREVIEFRTPLMRQSDLAGFVRVAVFATPTGGWLAALPVLAMVVLPVLLLTVAAYALGVYAQRGLVPLQTSLAGLAQTVHPGAPPLPMAQDLPGFARQMEPFLVDLQRWAETTQNNSASAQTATHLLTYRKEKAEAVLHAIPDAIVVVDEECLPTFANARAEHLLGTRQDAMLGHAPREWCDNAELLAFLVRFRNAASALSPASLTYTPTNMPDRHICVTAVPLFSPRDRSTVFGRLFLFRDVTTEFLARQAGAEFVSHVAHELKTPLNTLAVYSELLLDFGDIEEGERINAVNVIHEEAARMAGLINNLLNISKLDSGTLQLNRKRVKIHDLLQDAFDSIVPVARDKAVTVKLAMPPDLGSARLDKDLLRIAIDNLLSNGVKYSNAGGQVTLAAELLDNNEIQVRVQDQGIGISKEDCAHVFDKYYRADNAETAARSGHGLGLYLARQIIELHQGSITVTSELGRGTLFTLTLKAQPMSLEEG